MIADVVGKHLLRMLDHELARLLTDWRLGLRQQHPDGRHQRTKGQRSGEPLLPLRAQDVRAEWIQRSPRPPCPSRCKP